MERFQEEIKRSGNTLETDPKLRLPARPPFGPAFHDLGSSLEPSSSKADFRDAKKPSQVPSQTRGRSTQKFKPTGRNNDVAPSSSRSMAGSQSNIDVRGSRYVFHNVNRGYTQHSCEESDSGDEMDLLSGSQLEDYESRPSADAKRAKPPTINSQEAKDERDRQHIESLTNKSKNLAKLSFKKIVKPKLDTEEDTEPVDNSHNAAHDPVPSGQREERRQRTVQQGPTSPDSRYTSQDERKARDSVRGRDSDRIPASRQRNTKANARSSPSRSPSPKSPPRKRNAGPIPAILSRPKPRPRGLRVADDIPPSEAKTTQYGTRDSQSGSSRLLRDIDSSTIPASSSKNGPSSSRLRYRSRTGSKSPCSSEDDTTKQKPKPKKKPADFPLSPTSSPPPTRRTASAFPDISPIPGSKFSPTPRTATKSKASTSRVPAAFPSLSPAKYGASDDDTPIVRMDKGKGRALDRSNDEKRYEKKKATKEKEKAPKRHRQLEAFPMNTQMLQSIGTLSPARPRKRLSEDGSGDQRTSKRSKQEPRLRNQSPSRRLFEDEGDSITISPHVDPSTLCPYCDTPLPFTPSPLLTKILAETKKKSQRDPRPSNPLGRRAPLTVFIGVCQRHRFESQILPEAERKGWPKSIDWKHIGSRILKMKAALQSIIQEPAGDVSESTMSTDEADPNDWDVLYENRKTKKKKRRGAKAESVFWVEVMEEVKQQGLRSVTGVRGQFANFDKAQPGYYGEIGAVIIQQTLYNMFPPDEMDPTHIAPLTSNQFVQRILVPEVALRLIMEDKRLTGADGAKEALMILRNSSAYGVAMFPEDGGEWDTGKKDNQEEKLGVGDMIVMERARKRRKELEEEDEREEREEQQRRTDMEEAERKREEKEKRAKTRQKAKEDERNLLSSDTNAPEEPARPRPRPRPRAVTRSSSSMDIRTSDQPPTTLDIPKKTPRARTRSRSVLKDVDTDASSDNGLTDLYATDYEPPPRASSVGKRRSPSASESRVLEQDMPLPSNTTSKRMASLRIVESDSDGSTKSTTQKGRRQPSRARSTSKAAGKRSTPSLNATDDEIEIVDTTFNSKTPVQKRLAAKPFPLDFDDGDDQATPKPKSKTAKTAEKDLPPPVRMQIRRKMASESSENDFQMPAARQKSTTLAKPTRTTRDSASEQEYAGDGHWLKNNESYGWLLDDHSSPSQKAHLKPRNK